MTGWFLRDGIVRKLRGGTRILLKRPLNPKQLAFVQVTKRNPARRIGALGNHPNLLEVEMILHLRRCKKVPVEKICDALGEQRKEQIERRGPDVLRLMVKDAGAIFRIQDGASVANRSNAAL